MNKLIKKFFKNYSFVRLFCSKMVPDARSQGFRGDIFYILGRKHPIPVSVFSLVRKACHRISAPKPPFWAVLGPELPAWCRLRKNIYGHFSYWSKEDSLKIFFLSRPFWKSYSRHQLGYLDKTGLMKGHDGVIFEVPSG